jgi:hypothetical protein
MNIGGGVLGAGLGILGAFIGSGKKVQVPEWKGIDLDKTQRETVAGNAAVLPEAQKLAADITSGNLESYSKLLDLALPGMRQQVNSITDSLLRGELPQDVQSSILRSGAARSLGMGVGGSGFGRNLTLRDLGLTSMQAQQQGFSMYGALANQYSPLYRSAEQTGQFLTAAQRVEANKWNAERQWQRDMEAAGIAAQASPVNQNIGNILAQIGGGMAGASIQGLMTPSVPKLSGVGGGFDFGQPAGLPPAVKTPTFGYT